MQTVGEIIVFLDRCNSRTCTPSSIKGLIYSQLHNNSRLARLDFLQKLQLARVLNNNLSPGLSGLGTEAFNLLNYIVTFSDFSEHNVLAVQPGGLGGADEKLGAVGVGTSVGHGKNTLASVLQCKVLVLELVSVDGLAAGTVTASEVTTLAHEVGDDTVEGGATETETLLASAQCSEVLGGFGNNVGAQLLVMNRE